MRMRTMMSIKQWLTNCPDLGMGSRQPQTTEEDGSYVDDLQKIYEIK